HGDLQLWPRASELRVSDANERLVCDGGVEQHFGLQRGEETLIHHTGVRRGIERRGSLQVGKSPEAVEQLEAGIEAAGVGVLGWHGAPGRCINTADIAASGRRAHRYRRNERAVGLAPGGAGVALISARLHHGWLHTERALK